MSVHRWFGLLERRPRRIVSSSDRDCETVGDTQGRRAVVGDGNLNSIDARGISLGWRPTDCAGVWVNSPCGWRGGQTEGENICRKIGIAPASGDIQSGLLVDGLIGRHGEQWRAVHFVNSNSEGVGGT